MEELTSAKLPGTWKPGMSLLQAKHCREAAETIAHAVLDEHYEGDDHYEYPAALVDPAGGATASEEPRVVVPAVAAGPTKKTLIPKDQTTRCSP